MPKKSKTSKKVSSKKVAPTSKEEEEQLLTTWKRLYKRFVKDCTDMEVDDASSSCISSMFRSVLRSEEPLFPAHFIINKAVSAQAMKALMSALSNIPYKKLKSIGCIHSDIGDQGALQVVSSLRSIPMVTKLAFISCSITSRGCERLGREFGNPACYHLKDLILDGNALGSESLNLLMQGLCKNKNLQSLSLVSCELDDDAMSSLGAYVSENSALKFLNLEANSITDSGLRSLFEKKNDMKAVNISYNQIRGEEYFEQFVSTLSSCVTLSDINLKGNPIQARAYRTVIDKLKSGLLKHVYLIRVSPSIDKDVFTELHDLLKQNAPKSVKRKKKTKKKKTK